MRALLAEDRERVSKVAISLRRDEPGLSPSRGLPVVVCGSWESAKLDAPLAERDGYGASPDGAWLGEAGSGDQKSLPQTLSQLNTAIQGTSANTNAVTTLDTPFANDPLTLADLELLRAKVNELILNGRR